jgi:hypothetical protein
MRTRLMKILLIACGCCALLLGVSSSRAAPAPSNPPLPDSLGKEDVFFRVVREVPNGRDLHATILPLANIVEFEAQGKAVRPNRSTDYISYWALTPKGDVKTWNSLNFKDEPEKAKLGYKDIKEVFDLVPPSGLKWKKQPYGLSVAHRNYNLYRMAADDRQVDAKKGEFVLALRGEYGGELYYHIGQFIEKNPTSRKSTQEKTSGAVAAVQPSAASPFDGNQWRNTSKTIMENIENKHPSAYFDLAAMLYKEGKKDKAVFWYCLGQLRHQYLLSVADNSRETALNDELAAIDGSALDVYMLENLPKIAPIIEKVLAWDEKHPNGFTSKDKDAEKYKQARDRIAKFPQFLAEVKKQLDQQKDQTEKQPTSTEDRGSHD